MSEENSEKDYNVGYGKPPKSGQFKKGASGNPHGTSRKVRARIGKKASFGNLFSEGMQQPVEVEENGKKILITRMHLGIRKRVEAAAAGDMRALKEILKLRDVKDSGPLSPGKRLIFSLQEVCAAGPLGDVLYRPNTVLVRQRDPNEVVKRKPKTESESLPRHSARELIEIEFERQIRVTNAATGEKRHMTLREVIAEQLMVGFALNKRGSADLMVKLNTRVAEDREEFKKIYVSIPPGYEMPPKLPPNWRETMTPPATGESCVVYSGPVPKDE
ncbi:MAG: DUF5681 domain-containing protein [Rhizomicrobium sp.]